MPDFNESTAGVTVDVTSRLMQDYVAGTPIAPAAWWYGLTAPDGTENVFFIPVSSAVLSRAYRDAGSPTGWSEAVVIDFGTDPKGPPPPINVQRRSDAGGDVFRLIVSLPDRIILADLAADGTPGAFRPVASGQSCRSYGSATVSHYLPQFQFQSTPQSVSVSWFLCALDTFDLIPLNLDPAHYIISLAVIADGARPGLCRLWGARDALVNGVTTGPREIISLTATLRADRTAFDTTVEVLLPADPTSNVFADQAVHGRGSVELVALTQQPTSLSTIAGTFDPDGIGPVVWQQGKVAALAPSIPGGIMGLAARGGAGSDALEVFLTAFWEEGLWSSARAPGSTQWEPLSPLITKGYRPQLLPGPETRFLYFDPDGLGLWTRHAEGDWDVELIETPSRSGTPIEQPGFRIGITLSGADQFQGGVPVNVTSAVPVRCTVAGRTLLLDTVKPTPLLTDGTGTVWITLRLQDRFCVPELTLTSDAFAGSLRVTPDSAVQDYLAGLSSDDLSSAVDPRGSPPAAVLPDPGNAPAVAEAIRASMKAAAVARGLAASRRGAGPVAIPAEALAGLGAWTFEMQAGRASFARLDPEQAERHRAAILASPAWPSRNAAGLAAGLAAQPALAPHPMNIFDDAFDWIGDVAESAWNGLTELVTKIVVDGANMVLNLVIDGVNYAYQGVIDTLERAYDAVTFVLNAAGAQLGKAVGWLLSKLGFLFDWDALKDTRDALKARLRNGLHTLRQATPDPAVTATGIAANLGAARTNFDGWIAQYRSSPLDGQTYGGQMSSVFKSLEPLLAGSRSGFAEITWLIDKVRDALLRNLGLSGAPAIPGLAAAVSGVQQAVDRAAQGVSPTLGDATGLLGAWVLGGQLFSSSRFDPLLTIVQQHVDQVLAGIGQVAEQSGALLHLLWQNPDAIIDWLDTPINLPFFAGFYEGLTGNQFSLLDMVCMCAAVPASALGGAGLRRMGATATDGLHVAGLSFAIIGCFTEAWASFEIAANAEGAGKTANLVANLGTGICALIEGLEEKRMLNFGIVYLMGAAAIVVAPDAWRNRSTLGALAAFMMLIVRLPLAATTETKMTITQLLLMTQNLLEGFVQAGTRKPDPRAFAALQASLSGAATGLAYG